jgi:hypothetical protein
MRLDPLALGQAQTGLSQAGREREIGTVTHPLYGIVQHSFGLQVPERSRPFPSQNVLARVCERFDCHPFAAYPVSDALLDLKSAPGAAHSLLAQRGLTTLGALKPSLIRPGVPQKKLPKAFSWAEHACDSGAEQRAVPSLIFADEYDREGPSLNDFLISNRDSGKRNSASEKAEGISQTLLELMAHKRSRLFGFRLANRFVNVLLPYAFLSPGASGEPNVGSWFMQPVVSFLRGGRDRGRLRSTYSLTFFLIPVAGNSAFGTRSTSAAQIERVVNAGWGFAASPLKGALAHFDVEGDLFTYLGAVIGLDLLPGNGARKDVPLRRIIESVAFGAGVTLAQSADLESARLIGNDVLMALGSTRVSSVVVRDDLLEQEEVRRPVRDSPFPDPLSTLLETLATTRSPQGDDRDARKYRLDRPFIDDDLYAMGVVPVNRCLVVVSRGKAQYGVRESALMQAGSIAYMTIGAAAAIGTMRAIDRRLESLEGAGPVKIAEIDREIAADLGEIYDLDITSESYREIYRRLRKRLGIARDYKLLQDKMQAVYRATATLQEDRTQQRLVWLTAAIVVLSVFILLGTAVLIGQEG